MDIKDIVAKGAKANSAQELKELAAKENMPLTDEQAEECFAELQQYLKKQQTGELSDDELDDVNGGKCRISCPNVDPGGWCTEALGMCEVQRHKKDGSLGVRQSPDGRLDMQQVPCACSVLQLQVL